MKRRRTALWCFAGIAALLGVVALAVALAVYRPQQVRPWVERALTPRGGTASLAALRLSLSPPSLEISGLAITGPPVEGDLLRLDHLQFELIPSRFFHGGPWLRHVEVRGLVFERPRPRESKGPPDLTPLTRLFDIEDLSLSDTRLRVALPQGDLAADGIVLRLVPGEGGIRTFSGTGKLAFRRRENTLVEGTLIAKGTVTPGPAIEVGLESASARLMLPWLTGDIFGRTRLRVTPKRFQAEDLTLTMSRGQATLRPQATKDLGAIRLDAAASATLEVREPRLEVREFDIGGMLLARGRLEGSTLETMSGTLDGEIPQIARVKTFLAPLLPGSMAGMDLSGRLPFRLHLSGRKAARVLTLELRPGDLGVSWPRAGFGSRFGGSLRIASPLEGWNPGRVSLEWKLSAGADNVSYKGRPLPLGTLEVRGAAESAGDSFRVESMEIRSESLGRLEGALAFRGGIIGGRLKGAGLPADNLVILARALGGQGWKGWSATGAIDVAARIDPAESGSRVAATATIAGIGFSSPTGDAMGQNLAGKADIEAHLAPRPRMKADLILRGGEALWGKVYLDLAKVPLDLHAAGTRKGPDDYEDLALDGGLAGYGRLGVTGKARHAAGKWRHQGQFVLRDARLGPIFRTFLRDPLAASHRDLAGLEMDGVAEGDLSFSGTGQTADLAGTLRLRSGGVRRGSEPPLLSGLDIDLPIAYSLGSANPGATRPSDTAKWGRLRWKELRLAGQGLGPLEIPAVLVPNRLYLGGAIDTSLFGAKLSLRRIQVDEPLSAGFRIDMAAQLDGLDLARVAGDNSILKGNLGGVFDPVAIGLDRMTSTGTLTGDLFGGRLDIRRVTVERPFSAGREIGADVTVSLIDLERLSAALGVGRITGRLSGSIEGLRFAYGQPVAFHLKMESVAAKEVGQSVSIKAVNSIALVSTGSALSGLGVSLMTTFFKEFAYKKIGFECGLNNDVFTVRGLIHEDGVEYLVKRRFFSGINVINANPDNRIGFSDMVERAKRVTADRSR